VFDQYNRPASFFERVDDNVGTILNYIGDWIEIFYKGKLRVSIAEATASAVVAGFILSILSASDSSTGLNVKLFALNLITTLNCYLILTLTLHKLLRVNPLYQNFSWLIISLGGSMFAWIIVAIPMALTGWGTLRVFQEPIAPFMILFSSLVFVLLLNALTLPITAAIHFMGYMVKGMRL